MKMKGGMPSGASPSLDLACCRCQNRRNSGRGSQTVRLRRMVTGGRGHDALPFWKFIITTPSYENVFWIAQYCGLWRYKIIARVISHGLSTHPPLNVRLFMLLFCVTSCRCQNRRISGRGSQTVRLRRMVTGGREHDVLPRFGPSWWR